MEACSTIFVALLDKVRSAKCGIQITRIGFTRHVGLIPDGGARECMNTYLRYVKVVVRNHNDSVDRSVSSRGNRSNEIPRTWQLATEGTDGAFS